MWFLSNVAMCVLGNRNHFMLENLWFSRAFMCIFEIKSLSSVGYASEERTPPPQFHIDCMDFVCVSIGGLSLCVFV